MAGPACALGAWAGLPDGGSPAAWALPLALALALGTAATLLVHPRRRWVRRLAALLLFAACGLLAGLLAPRPAAPAALEEAARTGVPVRFVGRLAEPIGRHLAPPRWRSQTGQPRLTLVVDVEQVEIEGAWRPAAARVLLAGDDVPLASLVGDMVEGRAAFLRVRAPQNPGEPDARYRLWRKGISYIGGLERGALATLEPSSGAARRSEVFRAAFTRFTHDRLGNPDDAALVAALAVGERGGVSTELGDAFNASGLAHVLSISGLHLAVAVAALAWLLRRLFGLSAFVSARIAPKRLAALVALPVTVLYVVVIGAPPPAVRAGIGLGFVLFARIAGRTPDTWNTLGWALACVALLDPAALGDPSTQLSFLGVVGLAYFTPRLREWVPVPPPDRQAAGLRGLWERGREAVLLLVLGSVAATIATAPVTAAYFERASLVAAIANVVAWPASTLIVPAGALGALLFPVHPALAGPFVDVAGLCARVLSACARLFAAWPAASVQVPPPSTGQMVCYALFVLALANVRRWPRTPAITALAASAAAFVIALWPQAQDTGGRLAITFLSVGQGDSTVVRFPQGSTMVVDAGGEASGRFDPGARVVSPFLRSQGIRRIDLLVASHPHPDHIGGLPALLDRFEVGELWHNGDGAEDGPLAELLAHAREAGARTVDFRQGLPARCPNLPPLGEALPVVAALAVGDPRCAPSHPTRTIDGVTVEVLHPLAGPEKAAFPELGENDNSLVLKLTHGDVHVLLPGDLEREGEALLLAKGLDLQVDLLKAPHHGSRTSSTQALVRTLRPKHVVFCVGERNVFGFPAPEIEERYAHAGCRRWRTDEDGAVTFTSDGRSLQVQRFREEAPRR